MEDSHWACPIKADLSYRFRPSVLNFSGTAGVLLGTRLLDPARVVLLLTAGVESRPGRCDDGNTSNTDACRNSRVNASCGNAFIWEGVEQ